MILARCGSYSSLARVFIRLVALSLAGTPRASATPVAGAAAELQFLTASDFEHDWGRIEMRAAPVQPTARYFPPPLNYTRGGIVFGAFSAWPRSADAGAFLVYGAETAGPEPLLPEAAAAGEKPKLHVDVLRWVSDDLRSYRAPTVVLSFETGGDPAPYTMPTVKSMARDAGTGEMIMVVLGESQAINVYRSSDAGGTRFLPTTKGERPNFKDKDDVNVVHYAGRYIDMQVTKLRIEGGLPGFNGSFCDNLKSCDEKRVLAARNSTDGATWSADGPMRLPDADDPPELQFYRMRPFELLGGAGASRLAAHVLLYAPGPVMPAAYGRHPANCAKAPNTSHCHAPHLSEEWWVLPDGAAPEDLAGSWARPYRGTRAAPPDAFLMAQPLAVDATDEMDARCDGRAGDPAAGCGGGPRCSPAAAETMPSGWPRPNCSELVFLDGAGGALVLPGRRLGGVYAAANAVVRSPAFVVPASGCIWLDVNASWGARLAGGGCDEGCQAYVRVGLVDAATNHVLSGFEPEGLTAWDVNAVKLPLAWYGNYSAARLAGRAVKAQIHFRDAIVYGLSMA
jgi:hypothetical protein